jgi:periplasmic divalent cation tolerance protein
MESIVIVLTTVPDAESAKTLADSILRARLAACVTRLPGAQSRYWWQERIEEAQEELLLIKTTDDLTQALQAHIRAHHPYETPECLCLGVASGLPEYLQWVRQETTPHPTADRTDQSSSS